MIQQLLVESEKLNEGGLREFINGRKSELTSLIEEARKALAEGKYGRSARVNGTSE